MNDKLFHKGSNQAKRTILCEKSVTFTEAMTLNLNLLLMQRM